ncbi:WxL domain-containing protein [Candidatus Enterococcus mangumiae]|uniref:WxL domain-containing protein n=1 Tax=Candidatus Enterococcus mangumiae TaxID=2230878 RepID=A0ABZ2T0J3_9ENTE|nr:WxL domain-containing protein [Enterococcus sp. DIV1094]MBO0489943.1 WxL domain-containing protein [Enterococcus sp. DIV1094]
MKKIITTATFALLAASVCGGVAYAGEATEFTESTNKTNVTLTAGSGTDVEPVVPDDTHDDDPSTGDTGSLSIPFASNITFGQQEIKQGDADYYALNKSPYVQVNDTRGGAKGWTLGVTISPFVGENGHELKGAQMTLSNGQVVTKNNQSTAPTITQKSFDLNEQYQDVMLAKEGQGAGAFAATFRGEDGENKNVKLHVPREGVEAQAYSAEITWVLTDAPA